MLLTLPPLIVEHMLVAKAFGKICACIENLVVDG
jgi:hypothetical protein